ncbi:MAG: hypothetical protein MOGMAGMI_00783 [Candidatus Omnitrophica bacterium]|nr:hypothetical protein [Candidatus Omnitrophota bacterium]
MCVDVRALHDHPQLSTIRVVCATLAVLSLAAFAAYLHAWRWTAWGTEGHDAIFYQRVALEWSHGHTVFTLPGAELSYFRPVLYALTGLSYKLLGVSDHTLKILNLLCLVGTVASLYGTGRVLGVGRAWSALPAALYLYLPAVIRQTRVEQAHSLPALMMALALWALALHRKRPSLILAGFSALCAHAAAACHTDLVLAAPGLTLFLGLDAQGRWVGTRRWLGRTAVYTAVYLSPLVIYQALWGLDTVAAMLLTERGYLHPGSSSSYPVLMIQLLVRSIPDLLGPASALLMVLGTAHLWIRSRRGEESVASNMIWLAPWLSYVLLLDPVAERTIYTRLIRVLIPLIPGLLIYLMLRARSVVEQAAASGPNAARWTATMVVMILACAVAVELRGFPITARFGLYSDKLKIPYGEYRTVYRYLHDELAGRVGPEARLLLAPSQFMNPYAAANLPFYFDGDSVELRGCSGERTTLDAYLRRHRIRYVYVAAPPTFKPHLERLIRERVRSLCLGDPATYDAAAETAELLRALKPYGLRLISQHPAYGTVYELQNPA